MSDIAIRVSNVSKAYRVGLAETRSETFVGSITAALKSPIKRYKQLTGLKTAGKDTGAKDLFYALKDLSFEVPRGEVLGVVGRNGAGKSTLLKILSRITDPTSGRIDLFGRVSSLLEVGTGFHPELTGHENVYLNGTILGMRKTEIDRKFDEIVEFSGVEKFMHTPVKRYSSGMRVRLAFAVAAFLEPEILLIDEVLAVGDADFQRKCLGKMNDVANQGRTVLFVSHNMSAGEGLCRRCIWLQNGTLVDDGPADTIVARYLTDVMENNIQLYNKQYDFSINSVKLLNQNLEPTLDYRAGDKLIIDMEYIAKQPILKPYFIVTINNTYGACLGANNLLDGFRPEVLEGEGIVRCVFEALPLLPQAYSVNLQIKTDNVRDILIPQTEVSSFVVVGDVKEMGMRGDMAYKFVGTSVPVVTPYHWELNGSTIGNVSPYAKILERG